MPYIGIQTLRYNRHKVKEGSQTLKPSILVHMYSCCWCNGLEAMVHTKFINCHEPVQHPSTTRGQGSSCDPLGKPLEYNRKTRFVFCCMVGAAEGNASPPPPCLHSWKATPSSLKAGEEWEPSLVFAFKALRVGKLSTLLQPLENGSKGRFFCLAKGLKHFLLESCWVHLVDPWFKEF